jgi:hypothetical protein
LLNDELTTAVAVHTEHLDWRNRWHGSCPSSSCTGATGGRRGSGQTRWRRWSSSPSRTFTGSTT